MMSTGFILIGLAAGILGGLVGIGGGLIVIPALVMLFGFTQKMAQGTTLAMLLPPIGLGAAFLYWKQGNVDVRAAALLAVGFFVGGFLGAGESAHLSNAVIQKIFGGFTLLVSLKLLFFS